MWSRTGSSRRTSWPWRSGTGLRGLSSRGARRRGSSSRGSTAPDAPEQSHRRSPEEQQSIMSEYFAISELPGTVGGAQLQPTSAATTVRVANGDTLTTHGPFTETKEALGGFYLFDADNLDAALE